MIISFHKYFSLVVIPLNRRIFHSIQSYKHAEKVEIEKRSTRIYVQCYVNSLGGSYLVVCSRGPNTLIQEVFADLFGKPFDFQIGRFPSQPPILQTYD